MGSGKTTIGRLVAERLGLSFRDSDAGIEVRTGRTVRDLQADVGDDAMHEIEARELLEALAREEPSVIGAAASTIESDACRDALVANGVAVVWLRGSPELLASRFNSSRHRPVFGTDPEAFLRAQARRREPLFESVASVTVDIDGRDEDEVVGAVLEGLGESSPG